MTAQERLAAQRFEWLEGCGPANVAILGSAKSAASLSGVDAFTWERHPNGSKPAEFCYFRIETRDSQLVYVAQPHGVAPTAFTLLASSPRRRARVRRNPAHDFPKRVGYRRVSALSVLAFIDGGDGSASRVEFPMSRAARPAARAIRGVERESRQLTVNRTRVDCRLLTVDFLSTRRIAQRGPGHAARFIANSTRLALPSPPSMKASTLDALTRR